MEITVNKNGSVKEGRSVNFTPTEILILIEIVQKYKHIVECKKTDGTTWREKDECWSKITDELNSRCGEIYRKKKSVKTKYEDMKKNLKKKLSKNKAETFKTGGGTPKIQELTCAEEMLLSFLPSTIQGLPSMFDSDEKFDKQADYEKIIDTEEFIQGNINEEEFVEGNINDSQTADTDEWLYEALDSDVDNVENEEFTNRKRIYLESITNTSDKYAKKAKTLDIDDTIEKAELASKNEKNNAASISQKQLPSEATSTLSGIYSQQPKNVLKTKVSKELRVANVSKTFEKNDIVKLAIAKEELVQLQKTVLELDIHMKEKNNNTQNEILRTELEITKEKLKLIRLDIQLKQLELEIKRKQLMTLL